MKTHHLLAAALALALPLAHAQSNDTAAAGTSGFKQLDKNGDSSISQAEAAGDKEIAKRFKAFDANKDGKLSEEEYLKAHAEADARYAQILTLLIAEAKRPK